MERKDPVPYRYITEYDYNEIEPCVKAIPRKKRERRSGSFIRIFLSLLTCICIALLLYVNRDGLRLLANSLLFGGDADEKDTDSITDTKSDTGNACVSTDTSQSNTDTPPDKTAFYAIKNVDMSGSGLENQTSLKFDVSKFRTDKISLAGIYTKYGKEAPVVLIIHSCANEAYSNGEKYSENSAFYSDSENVAAIGEKIASVLNRSGVNCIHLSENFGNGALHCSRTEYEKALCETLKKYPSISYVIDVSRDIEIEGDMTMKKPISDDGYAQIRLSVGSGEIAKNPYWSENLAFAISLSEYISHTNRSIMRPCVLSRFPLSQQFSKMSIRADIGSYSNTFEEAVCSAEFFGLELSSYISEE